MLQGPSSKLSQHFQERLDPGLNLIYILLAVIGLKAQIGDAPVIQLPLNGQRFHLIGLAELKAVMDHPVGLVIIHHLAHMLGPVRVGGEDGAVHLEVSIHQRVHQLIRG